MAENGECRVGYILIDEDKTASDAQGEHGVLMLYYTCKKFKPLMKVCFSWWLN